MENKKLYRTEGPDVKLAGVCGGVAEYFNIDPTVVRIAWVVLTLASVGMGLVGYLACAVIMPRKSDITK